MTTSSVIYQGGLRTAAVHLQSNNQIITDAPVDNHGKGEAFSLTDLLATSLASCMLTIMGIKADDMGLDIAGSKAEVTKTMATNPRRVSEVAVQLTVKGVSMDKDKKIMEKAALTCPVANSIHPDIKQLIAFEYV